MANKNISVNNIIKNHDSINTQMTETYVINLLKKTPEETKKALTEYYKKIYVKCLGQIKDAHASGKTDLLFEIPIQASIISESLNECSNISDQYNLDDCIEFIETQLHKNNIVTYKFRSNILFITWRFINIL